MDAVDATIKRLNKLGTVVRNYSASSLERRTQAFTEKYGDDNYGALARLTVQFMYHTATASLQEQLAVSMSTRRQGLNYMERHQEKLGNRQHDLTNKQSLTQSDRKVTFASALTASDEAAKEEAPKVSATRKEIAFRQTTNNPFRKSFATSETNASSFKPTSSAIGRLRKDDGGSVVSSSTSSKTPILC